MIFSTFISVFIVSCSSENDCFVVDQAEQIRILQIEKQDYYLYLKVAGWHDKITFYELYEREPIFDQCGVSETHPISVMDVDPDLSSGQEKVSGLIINSQSKEITIIYSKDDSQAEYQQELKNVPIGIERI